MPQSEACRPKCAADLRASAGPRQDDPWTARAVNASSSDCVFREHVAWGGPHDSQQSVGHQAFQHDSDESAAPRDRRFRTRFPTDACAREVRGIACRHPTDAHRATSRAADGRSDRRRPLSRVICECTKTGPPAFPAASATSTRSAQRLTPLGNSRLTGDRRTPTDAAPSGARRRACFATRRWGALSGTAVRRRPATQDATLRARLASARASTQTTRPVPLCARTGSSDLRRIAAAGRRR